MSIKELTEKTGSKAEKSLMNALAIIGFMLVVAVLFKPFVAYFTLGVENVRLDIHDLKVIIGGLLVSVGNRKLAPFINNIFNIMSSWASLRAGATKNNNKNDNT